MHYKAPDNSLHVIEPEFVHMLPSGSVEITDDDAEVIRVSSIIAPTYAELRATAYPPMQDYLDGIVKGDTDQIAKYIADCLAVKELYPKS